MQKLQRNYMVKILKIIYISKMVYYKYKKRMLEQQDQKMIIFLKNIDIQKLNKEMLEIQENIMKMM